MRSLKSLLLFSTALLLGCSFDGSGLSSVGDLSSRPDRAADTRPPTVDVLPADVLPADVLPADVLPADVLPADVLPPDVLAPDTLPPCPTNQVRCEGLCVDLGSNTSHCGQCNKPCASGEVCESGLCCAAGLRNCGGVCVDTNTDAAHCSDCNIPCLGPKQCSGGSCVDPPGCDDGTDEQLFTQGMRGCSGSVTFAQRASLCAPGFRVCTAAEWVARRSGVAPTYNYWTDDTLDYYGSGSSNCYVVPARTGGCTNTSPMRVCAGTSDALNNKCNWTHCGFNQAKPDEYFGGCMGNTTAGTLCCPQ